MSIAVPIVDLNDFFDPKSRDKFVQKLGDAFREFGFVRVAGHNVTPQITTPAYDVVKQFFALPHGEKSKYIIHNGAGQRGYTPFLSESAKDSNIPDLKEFWHVGRELPPEHSLYDTYPPNIWPKEIKDFQSVLLTLYDELETCSEVLLQALALYIGEDVSIFTNITKHGNSILRSLYYPALEGKEVIPGAIRAAPHEDINFITLLIASTSNGLQILTQNQWVDVDAQPGELIADAGDMLSRVTNGYSPRDQSGPHK